MHFLPIFNHFFHNFTRLFWDISISINLWPFCYYQAIQRFVWVFFLKCVCIFWNFRNLLTAGLLKCIGSERMQRQLQTLLSHPAKVSHDKWALNSYRNTFKFCCISSLNYLHQRCFTWERAVEKVHPASKKNAFTMQQWLILTQSEGYPQNGRNKSE